MRENLSYSDEQLVQKYLKENNLSREDISVYTDLYEAILETMDSQDILEKLLESRSLKVEDILYQILTRDERYYFLNDDLIIFANY